MAKAGLAQNLKYRFEYAAFRAVGGLLRLLPVEAASRLSGLGWRLIAPLLHRHQRALGNLRIAFPEKSASEIDAIARAMWANLGRTFAESFHLDEFREPGRIVVENSAAVSAFNARGGGVICAPHLSNWELNAVELVRRGAKAAAIYQRVKNPLVNAFVLSQRRPLYPGGMHEKSNTAPRAMLRHARAGGTVVMLTDLRDAGGVAVPFFGRPAPSSPFAAIVARRLGVSLAVTCLVREADARFRMKFEEIAVPVTDDRDADILEATARIQAAFERFVRAHPEQWMWAHRRWG